MTIRDASLAAEHVVRRARRTLQEAGVSLVARRVLAMCSGGADSIALLAVLAGLPRGAAPARVDVVWIDHGVRGDVAVERGAARAAAERWGMTFHERRIALDERSAGGFEAAARTERYAAACLVARALGADVVATGHTASDQLELALLAIVGATGRAGAPDSMPVARVLEPGLELVRPLLGSTHDDAVALCTRVGTAWVDDPTNADAEAHVRNAVRHRVVPELLRAHAGAGQALLRAGRRQRAASASCDSLVGALLDAWHVGGGELDLRHLDPLDDGARAHVVAAWLRRSGLGRALDAQLVGRVLALQPGQRIDLPRRACVRRAGYHVQITQAAPGGATP